MFERIVKCFKNIGIIIDETENIKLTEYLTDSVMFISFLVELENEFNLEIPDEYLLPNKLTSLDDVGNMLLELQTMTY